jgi:hypothetical protein
MVMMTDSDSPLISEGPPMWKLREEMEREAEEFPGEGNEFDNDDPMTSLLFL